jgi:CRISPR-associated endonuclease/helicase Cas3
MDQAEQAAKLYAARRFAARVMPELAEQWLARERLENEAEGATDLDVALPDLTATLAEYRDQPASELLDAVLELRPLPASMRAWLELLRHRRGRLERVFAYGFDSGVRPRGVVFLAAQGIRAAALEAAAEDQGATPATEDDWLGSTPGYAQTLEEHSCWVRDRAVEFSRNSGVTAAIADDIALAAYLHDAGKADPRFQTMLYGGDWFAVDDATILAKSDKRVDAQGWTRAGLPDKWRHEALSVRLAREHVRFQEANDGELVLWLIGVHHGYGRPLFPHADEAPPTELPDVLGGLTAASGPGPQSLNFSFDGRDWTQIFERLKHRYGVWELAWMEAIIRLADHRASEAAARRGREDVA